LVGDLPAGFEFPRGLDEIAALVERFLAVDSGGATWVLVLAEFRMLALRDRDMAKQFLEFERRIDAELGAMLESSIGRLGMEFTIEPAEFARLAAIVYEAGVQESILSGEPSRLARRSLPELVQAFTRQAPG
ncbi:MAG TPA: hypothetical protein PK890_08155, partial [Terrimesophilobacter sp.]|nr:hypothetical protein [Terrimesophilobacter sp.]